MLPSRLLCQFLTVADRGSLRAASVTFGVSQPALTKNDRQLEVGGVPPHSRGIGEALRRRTAVRKVTGAEFSTGTTIVHHTAGGRDDPLERDHGAAATAPSRTRRRHADGDRTTNRGAGPWRG